jgi:uncharacterized membrane protein YfcA
MPALPPDLSPALLLGIATVVLLAYTILGATGFGSAIVAVPLLAHALPLTVTVPLITSLDLFAATATAVRHRRQAEWPEFRRIAPVAVLGMVLGATLLLNLPPRPALLALGIYVSLYGTYVLSGARRLRTAPDWLAWPIGVVGGIFSVLFGTGGPIYMVYLSARIADKGALRATSILVVAQSVWLRIVLFVATGILLDLHLLALIATIAPAMLLGVWAGHRLHHLMSSTGVLRLIAALLLANGVTLLVRYA